jgi:hypothetical protein
VVAYPEKKTLNQRIYSNLEEVVDKNRYKPSASFQTALLDIQF